MTVQEGDLDHSNYDSNIAEEDEPALSVVQKVALIVETLREYGSLSTIELARAAGLSKTTVRRHGLQLAEWGVLEHRNHRYSLGRRLAELGLMVTTSESLGEQINPYAAELCATFRRAVTVMTLQGDQARCIVHVAGTQDDSACAGPGTRAPVHATAAGKAILAFSPPGVFAEVVSRPLVRLTPYTICSPQALALAMREARRTGFATMRQESRLGHASVAVPIHNRTGVLLGAMAMSVPLTGSDLTRYAKGLKAQAGRLATLLN
jgi:DNA-binding IclR family transcriptional regulator